MSYRNLKITLPILFKLFTVIGFVVLKVCIVFGGIPNFHFLRNVKELKKKGGGGGGGGFNFKMSLPILFKPYILIGCVVFTRLYKSKFIEWLTLLLSIHIYYDGRIMRSWLLKSKGINEKRGIKWRYYCKLCFFLAAFCMCEVWTSILWNKALWEERISLLWNSLSPGLWF